MLLKSWRGISNRVMLKFVINRVKLGLIHLFLWIFFLFPRINIIVVNLDKFYLVISFVSLKCNAFIFRNNLTINYIINYTHSFLFFLHLLNLSGILKAFSILINCICNNFTVSIIHIVQFLMMCYLLFLVFYIFGF